MSIVQQLPQCEIVEDEFRKTMMRAVPEVPSILEFFLNTLFSVFDENCIRKRGEGKVILVTLANVD
jgi:hypothetical protein